MKKNINKFILIIPIFFSMFFLTTIESEASCIYNKVASNRCTPNGSYQCFICSRLDCGIFCANNFNFIDQDKRKCRPGKGGSFTAGLLNVNAVGDNPTAKALMCTPVGPIGPRVRCNDTVKDHGWVNVSNESEFTQIGCDVRD
ncbi:MAG: hypothetical protein ACR2NW_04700 [Thermodesulfobacteriota bacterium]